MQASDIPGQMEFASTVIGTPMRAIDSVGGMATIAHGAMKTMIATACISQRPVGPVLTSSAPRPTMRQKPERPSELSGFFVTQTVSVGSVATIKSHAVASLTANDQVWPIEESGEV